LSASGRTSAGLFILACMIFLLEIKGLALTTSLGQSDLSHRLHPVRHPSDATGLGNVTDERR
jgi:hypothetical protein